MYTCIQVSLGNFGLTYFSESASRAGPNWILFGSIPGIVSLILLVFQYWFRISMLCQLFLDLEDIAGM